MDGSREAIEAQTRLLEAAADEGSLDHVRAAKLKAAIRRYVLARQLLKYGGVGDEPIEEIEPIRPIKPI
ncbi:MAG: hypothetical protein JO140_03280 [Candidatus Eremiobacteraeota bacterium]|nr:hypothetical protein [Candidatus Eremiobacteraeota bacterium]